MIYLKISIIIFLLVIFLQDIKFRAINVLLLVAVFLLSYFLVQEIHSHTLTVTIKNTLFFLTTFLLLTVYMFIKNGKFENPFNSYFGLGDFLFYISVTPLFMLKEYVVFFIISMLFSIILQSLFKKQIKKESIPLAGFSSVLLIMILLFAEFNILKMALI